MKSQIKAERERLTKRYKELRDAESRVINSARTFTECPLIGTEFIKKAVENLNKVERKQNK